jgi:hypothetical protein
VRMRLAAVVVILAACNGGLLTLDDVIARNTKAMGGREALEAVNSIEVDLHITDPGFEVDGIYHAARPGRMRIDVRAGGGRVFTEAFDGRNGWEWDGKGDRKPTSPKGAAALRHGVELPGKIFGLQELQRRGNKIELVGRERVEGVDYYVLRLTLSDGYVTSLYIDPQSWLIIRRRDVRPLHVDIDPTPTTIEQRSSDFHAIAGVQFAFATTEIDLKTGKELERTKINGIKINPPIDQSIFERP